MKEKDVLILFKQPHLTLMKVITRSQARSLIFKRLTSIETFTLVEGTFLCFIQRII